MSDALKKKNRHYFVTMIVAMVVVVIFGFLMWYLQAIPRIITLKDNNGTKIKQSIACDGKTSYDDRLASLGVHKYKYEHLSAESKKRTLRQYCLHYEKVIENMDGSLSATSVFCTLIVCIGLLSIIHDIYIKITKNDDSNNDNKINNPLYNSLEYVSTKSTSITTTTGIFGTFFGLATGLANIGETPFGTITLEPLFASLSIAFWSSIFGIGTGLFVMLLHHFIRGGPEKLRSLESIMSELKKVADKDSTNTKELLGIHKEKFPIIVEHLEMVSTNTRQTNTDLSNLGNKITENVSSIVKKTIDKTVSSVVQNYSEQLSKISTSASEISEKADKLCSNYSGFEQQMQLFIEKQGRTLEVSSNIYSKMEDMSNGFNNLNQSLEKSRDMIKSFSEVAEEANRASNGFKDTVSAITHSLSEFVKHAERGYYATDQYFNNLDSIKNQLENIVKGNAKQFTSSQTDMVDSLKQIVTNLERIEKKFSD